MKETLEKLNLQANWKNISWYVFPIYTSFFISHLLCRL